ncbi:hypothetical protein P4472_13635 [Bacillus subtilis]|nr:hypothetical protein [Bacillus subtilis]MED3693418.1 hypothetical protein [Bacillus subtilis]
MIEWGVDDKVSKIKDNVIEKTSDLKFEAELKIDEIKEKLSQTNDGSERQINDLEESYVNEKANIGTIVDEHDKGKENVQEKAIAYKFGQYENIKLEQCNALFRNALTYENIRISGDNLLDYDMEKDFRMASFMMDLTGYAVLYENSFTIDDNYKYGNKQKI